jgi:hypothetical protein
MRYCKRHEEPYGRRAVEDREAKHFSRSECSACQEFNIFLLITNVSLDSNEDKQGEYQFGAKGMTTPEYVDVRTVKPGTRLKLADDSEIEVTQNPEGGYWVLARYLSSPSEPSREGKEEMIFWGDIVGKF